MVTRIFTMAEIPEGLEKKWVQHLRDFDRRHPECSFGVLMDRDAAGTIEEMEQKFREVVPNFSFMEMFLKVRSAR